MQITIIKLFHSIDEGIPVEFVSRHGIAKGLWKGSTPEINQSYFIEIDIPKILIWGTDIIEDHCKEFRVWVEQNNVFLNVQLECWEEDNCTTVRLGDSLILLETEGVPSLIGSYLRIQSKEILLYPYNL